MKRRFCLCGLALLFSFLTSCVFSELDQLQSDYNNLKMRYDNTMPYPITRNYLKSCMRRGKYNALFNGWVLRLLNMSWALPRNA